jgi:hypothetical protein
VPYDPDASDLPDADVDASYAPDSPEYSFDPEDATLPTQPEDHHHDPTFPDGPPASDDASADAATVPAEYGSDSSVTLDDPVGLNSFPRLPAAFQATKFCAEVHLITVNPDILRSPSVSEYFELGARCRIGDGDEIFDDMFTYLDDRIHAYVDLVFEISMNIGWRSLPGLPQAAIQVSNSTVLQYSESKARWHLASLGIIPRMT